MRRLLIRPGAIGDTIVSLPALAWLCQDVEAEIWAPARNLPPLRHLAPVRSFQQIQIDLFEIHPPPGLAERLSGFDEIVSWYGAAREEFRQALTRANANSRFLSALPPRDWRGFAGDFYCAQVGMPARSVEPHGGAVFTRGASTLVSTLASPTLHDSIARIPLQRRPRGFLAIQPFSGSPRKNWPLAGFAEVAAQLSRAHGLAVEWCAGPEEPLAGARRFDTLDGVMEWLASASLYVGNDSGISHLAAACGVPTVAVFVDSDAQVWAPRGRHVAVVERPASSGEVFTVADSLLRRLAP